jgi:hypothetical protein
MKCEHTTYTIAPISDFLSCLLAFLPSLSLFFFGECGFSFGYDCMSRSVDKTIMAREGGGYLLW